MDGLPVTVRLIDPPLHEFLPALEDLTARVAHAEALGQDPDRDGVLLTAVRRMHEENPMRSPIGTVTMGSGGWISLKRTSRPALRSAGPRPW